MRTNYSCEGRYKTKREATGRAKQMRKEGWYARIVKEQWLNGITNYAVFVKSK